jgi:hypothetical protein
MKGRCRCELNGIADEDADGVDDADTGRETGDVCEWQDVSASSILSASSSAIKQCIMIHLPSGSIMFQNSDTGSSK